MKRFLLIFFTFLFSDAYSQEKNRLLCSYKQTYYHNWDQNMFGEIIEDGVAQKSIFFSIIKSNKNFSFETDFLTNWDWISGAKIVDTVTDKKYHFKFTKKNKYMVVSLNRYTGSLLFTKGYTDDQNRYLYSDEYHCKKAKQKF